MSEQPTSITVDYDRLVRAARLAHEGHDPFAPEHCQREVCREIAAMMGRDGRDG